MSKFTIGTDPEFMLVNVDGNPVSAIPFIEGTKHNPQMLSTGNVQRDNVAMEIATDPADSMEGFLNSIQTTLGEAIKLLPKNLKATASPSATFDPKELDNEEAKAFGCSPDACAWKCDLNNAPRIDNKEFRTFGAHVHFGSSLINNSFASQILTVRLMDCFLGLPFTVLDTSVQSIARRELYGKPGCHRLTSYGVEYRVLSNYWLKSKNTTMLVYSLVEDVNNVLIAKTGEQIIESTTGLKYNSGPMPTDHVLYNTIMTGNYEKASDLLDEHIYPHMSKLSVELFNKALDEAEQIEHNNIYTEWGVKI